MDCFDSLVMTGEAAPNVPQPTGKKVFSFFFLAALAS
jgi:hypothetical protein